MKFRTDKRSKKPRQYWVESAPKRINKELVQLTAVAVKPQLDQAYVHVIEIAYTRMKLGAILNVVQKEIDLIDSELAEMLGGSK